MSLKHIFNENSKYDIIDSDRWNMITNDGVDMGVMGIINSDGNLDIPHSMGNVTINMSSDVNLKNLDVNTEFILSNKTLSMPLVGDENQILTLDFTNEMVWGDNTYISGGDSNMLITQSSTNVFNIDLESNITTDSLTATELIIDGKQFESPNDGTENQVLTLDATKQMAWSDIVNEVTSDSLDIIVSGTQTDPIIELATNVVGLTSLSATTLNAESDFNLNNKSMDKPNDLNYVLASDNVGNMVWKEQKTLLSSVGNTITITSGVNDVCNLELNTSGVSILPTDFTSGQDVVATGSANNIALNLSSTFYESGYMPLKMIGYNESNQPISAFQPQYSCQYQRIGNRYDVLMRKELFYDNGVDEFSGDGPFAYFIVSGFVGSITIPQYIKGKYSLIVNLVGTSTYISYVDNVDLVVEASILGNTQLRISCSQPSSSGNTPVLIPSIAYPDTWNYFISGMGYQFNSDDGLLEPTDILISYYDIV